MEDKTKSELGVTEVIFAASACSILFALFAGQPMMIIGATGPILVFEQSIYEVILTLTAICMIKWSLPYPGVSVKFELGSWLEKNIKQFYEQGAVRNLSLIT